MTVWAQGGKGPEAYFDNPLRGASRVREPMQRERERSWLKSQGRHYGWTSLWYTEFWCQCQRRQKPVGARCLAHLDEQGQHAQQWRRPSEAARCGLPQHPCFDAVEAVVTTLATQKLTEPRVDVDSWRYRPFPHIRLARRCGRSSLLFCHAKSTRGGAG